MGVEKKRLADYGVRSERVMWQGKGPSKFEQELGDLEQALMTTTLSKAVHWAQTKSMCRTSSGSPAARWR